MSILSIEVTLSWAQALMDAEIIIDRVIVDGTGKCDDSIVINERVSVSVGRGGSAHVVVTGTADDGQQWWDFGESWEKSELQNLLAEIAAAVND